MPTDVNTLIASYGYWALFIGCLAEGETFTLLGGVAAHQGLLHFGWVLLVAAVGGMAGDTVLYFLGRHFGDSILKRFKKHKHKIESAQKTINRHPILFVIGVRFMYGLRIVGPIIIGASRLAPAKFMLLNCIGAIIWATLFVSLGYAGGELIAPWLHVLDHHIKQIFWVLLAIALVWGIRILLRRRKGAREND